MARLPRPAEHVLRAAAKSAGQPRTAVPQTPVPQTKVPRARPGSVESLYPSIYPSAADPAQVLAQAYQSTAAKTREIIDLRTEVCARSSGLLALCATDMAARFAAGGRLLTFGNGGSATDAADLVTLFLHPPGDARCLPAIGLANDVGVLTALANDIGVEVVFSRQIEALGRPADIAVGLSTSGNSENLLRALDEAHRMGLLTIGVSGYDGGKMAEIASLDYLFIAPSVSIHRIQEAQTTIYHILWELVLAELNRRPVIT
jgi:D-sedoheptulose 7-phosphate isomerase